MTEFFKMEESTIVDSPTPGSAKLSFENLHPRGLKKNTIVKVIAGDHVGRLGELIGIFEDEGSVEFDCQEPGGRTEMLFINLDFISAQ